MSNQESNTIQHNTQNVLNTNPYEKMNDLIMQGFMLKLSSNIISNPSDLNFKTFLSLFLIMFIQESQSLVKDFIESIKKHIKDPSLMKNKLKSLKNFYNDYIKGLIPFLSLTIYLFKKLFFKKENLLIENDNCSKEVSIVQKFNHKFDDKFKDVVLKWKINAGIWKMFIDYAKTNPNFKYKTFNKSAVSSGNLRDTIYENKITALELPLKNCVMRVNDIVVFSCDNHGLINSIDICENKSASFNRISELINNPKLSEYIDDFVEWVFEKYPETKYNSDYKQIYIDALKSNYLIQDHDEHLYLIVAQQYNLDPLVTYLELSLICHIVGRKYKIPCESNNFGIRFNVSKSHVNSTRYHDTLWINNYPKYHDLLLTYRDWSEGSKTIIKIPLNINDKEMNEVFINLQKDNIHEKTMLTSKKDHLTVNLSSKKNISYSVFRNDFTNLLDSILEYHKDQKKEIPSVNVFELRLEHFIEMEEKPNPEYEKYILEKERQQTEEVEKNLKKKEKKEEEEEEEEDEEDLKEEVKKHNKSTKSKKGRKNHYNSDSEDEGDMFKYMKHMAYNKYNYTPPIPQKTISKPIRKFSLE